MPTSKPVISEPRSSVRQRIVGRARLFVTMASGSYRLPLASADAVATQVTPQADVLAAAWPDAAPPGSPRSGSKSWQHTPRRETSTCGTSGCDAPEPPFDTPE